MALRRWQSECLSTLLKKYQDYQTHCLVTATPGAGKTFLAATLVKNLFERGLIDFVICIAPSVDVADGFKVEISSLTNRRMDGRLGAFGESRTYHSLTHLDERFWEILDDNNVLIIVDEIHHCGGLDLTICNSWGLQLLKHVKDRATYTLALSGTPWRTDRLPVTLNNYMKEIGSLTCDYTYSLTEAIADNVCRIPRICVIDNSELHYESVNGESKSFSNIQDILASGVPFQELLKNDKLIGHVIGSAVNQLSEIRLSTPDAAGLIVASNIKHANHIAGIIRNQYSQDVVVITSHDKNARESLQDFKKSIQPWVVSVGMISEGTNIPRLQVCCYLSRIKTELYFRQVLGRILRVTHNASQYAYLYILAEPKLKEFAQRVDEDIPYENILIDIDITQDHSERSSSLDQSQTTEHMATTQFDVEDTGTLITGENEIHIKHLENELKESESSGSSSEGASGTLNVYGAFLEQLIALERIDGALISS